MTFKGGYVRDSVREAKSYGILHNPRLQTALYASSECFSAALADPNVDSTLERRNQKAPITKSQCGQRENTRRAEGQLFEMMVADLRDGRIKPTDPINQLRKFYDIADSCRLLAAMRAACRQYETEAGKLLIVVNGESGIIFRSFNCPPGLSRRNSRRNSEKVESLAFSAIEATMDSDPDSFFNLFCDEREVLLHVYSMPKDDYSRLDGLSVKDYGDHILTHQSWDREIKDIDAPFPEDDPMLLPKASYLYSPKRGYQGFDGLNWRSDWYRR